jgi:hypothetical protein
MRIRIVGSLSFYQKYIFTTVITLDFVAERRENWYVGHYSAGSPFFFLSRVVVLSFLIFDSTHFGSKRVRRTNDARRIRAPRNRSSRTCTRRASSTFPVTNNDSLMFAGRSFAHFSSTVGTSVFFPLRDQSIYSTLVAFSSFLITRAGNYWYVTNFRERCPSHQ